MTGPLGRRAPADWRHVERHPTRRAAPPGATYERVLSLPSGYRARYDQGQEGSCVGFACSWLSSLDNRRFYAARWLYGAAQARDEFPDTPPGEGTTVRAGMDVLRNIGHRRVYAGRERPASLAEGIAANTWATTVDEVRATLGAGVPVVLGIDWYEAFFTPVRIAGAWWIGTGPPGPFAGGHAICAYGVSDRRQAVKLVNSWGTGYPVVWLPYTTLAGLLLQDGEATMVEDRP